MQRSNIDLTGILRLLRGDMIVNGTPQLLTCDASRRPSTYAYYAYAHRAETV